MLDILAFFAEVGDTTMPIIVAVVRYVLAILALVCAGFITFVVMKQSGNSDGTEAFTGTSSQSDDSESYYGKNKGKSTEAKLRMWTYICAGVLAVSLIVFLILG